MIALRQAGFEPVVASMGTALTERQLRELGRLTQKLFLCFDADAAGQEATLRGMELAAAQGFDVKVVTLAAGPGSGRCARRLRGSAGRRRELPRLPRPARDRALGRPAGGFRPRAGGAREGRGLARAAGGAAPARRPARSPARDAARASRRRAGARARTGVADAPRLLEAGDRLERDVLAACLAHPSLVRGLAELTPEHFDSEPNRRFRDALVAGQDDPELTALRAELDARAAQEAIDERTGTELLLRLRERKLKRDLAGADLARTTELQAHLAKVRQALAELERAT